MMTGYIFAALGVCFVLAVMLAMLAEYYRDRKERRVWRRRKTTLPPTFWRNLGVM